MRLKEIMTPGVEVISPEATIQEAAQKMSQLDVGPLPVCDGEQLVGMLTDRDITVRAVVEGCDPMTRTVREAMTPDMVYCFEDQAVQEAARLMEQYQMPPPDPQSQQAARRHCVAGRSGGEWQ
jgi:CBS domain-containing protein